MNTFAESILNDLDHLEPPTTWIADTDRTTA